MKNIDEIKLEFLKLKMKERKIKKPTRQEVMDILKVSYPQAYNYMLALKNGN